MSFFIKSHLEGKRLQTSRLSTWSTGAGYPTLREKHYKHTKSLNDMLGVGPQSVHVGSNQPQTRFTPAESRQNLLSRDG
ncbi:unnamed protein product [Pleuronectes platessa]|uniref:Uncharacterized protein n=1 Tax=Pleuronectes platessa TaxID=8262 RepID=A0A9N7YX51_PLEPL|nr:unnamed protein product [Pleuronectes platessa]